MPATDPGHLAATTLAERFSHAMDELQSKLVHLVVNAPLLLVAILIVLFSLWLGGVVSRRMHVLRRISRANPYMDGLLRSTVRALIGLAGVLVALDMLGATSLVGAVLGSAGVVGLVLGFAFKDIAENYIAGVLLSIRKPFAPGDSVLIDSHEGKVIALTSRATILMTSDGSHLQLPNSLVFKSVLLNQSRNPKRRFDFTITIDGSQSIRAAQSLAIAQIAKVEGVLPDPGPSWVVQEFSPNGIALRFFGWIDQRENDLGKVRSEAIRVVKSALAHAGIEGPRTTWHVITERHASAVAPAREHAEPPHGSDADTSVNRDIDAQLAHARAADEGHDLLSSKGTAD
ncbi:MAG: mechanosensitive ion channel family protein [Thermomonas sp.]|uniref:mechanosensitive ion channel family protein n=1 Tax=Thermomonas sp. TaxID=1971895 RepID=UPI0039E2D12C